MTSAAPTAPPPGEAFAGQPGVDVAGRSQAAIVWSRLRRHPLGIAGATVLVLFALAAWLGPELSPYTFNSPDLRHITEAPSAAHPFGTSELGEDVLTRVLRAGRVSLAVGLFTALIACAVGSALGLLAGWYGSVLDSGLARVVDVFLTVPAFLVLIVLSLAFGRVGLAQIILILALLSWAALFRLVRASVLRTKELEYVLAAKAMGASSRRIMVRHLLPAAVPDILVFGTLAVGVAILAETALSFLGLGINPQISPSWGNLMSDSRETISQYWWLTVFPGMFVLLTVLAVNFLGDALRDALDPHGPRRALRR
jgi:peptide/nickel transport system permease protein